MAYSCASPGYCDAALPELSMAQMCRASTFVIFMSLLDKLIRSNDKISGRCERIKPIEKPYDEYDFVVIGGGGAGSVVAARLSENPDWRVLVIEAGPDEPPGGEIPALNSNLIDTEVDWNFTTTNDSHACLRTNGSCAYTAGKMLGGSTAHNGMLYIRGLPKDYDNWKAQGNEGWEWEEVKKFFLLSEDNGEIERVGRFYHSTGGPLSVERFPYLPPFGNSCLAACVQAGYEINNDINGAQVTGFSVVQSTTKNGVRRSSASAFLRPARNRKNLHVSLNSHATRIIIENKKAIGVEYYKNGKLRTVRASREVVVSAGAIMSPQVLLLSGIGPKKHLDSVGVKMVKDLPGVGKNLHDHIYFIVSFTINETDIFDNNWAAAFEYVANQTGPMSSIGLSQITGRIASSKANPDFPDIQIIFLGYDAGCAPGGVDALRSTGKRIVSLVALCLHPKSKGRISLASKNPLEYPVFWGNYLSDPNDVDVLVESIEVALKLADTKALRAHNITLANTPIEACSKYKFRSTKYWACAVRYGAGPGLHAVGSCKMGPASDPKAVVDHRLRVHGIKRLRVADASIMPEITSGNTAAPSMMIGERAADFIKKDWI